MSDLNIEKLSKKIILTRIHANFIEKDIEH